MVPPSPLPHAQVFSLLEPAFGGKHYGATGTQTRDLRPFGPGRLIGVP